uniref:Uncharacterized protein n=1 Tax=Pyrodinium bahamense TaxID=73915 RepID=A0A7S0AL01_9DINO|mmetsp:Transcript_36935/g.102592  ORF Transcript_36935/g.102592 Transcript_36935/m.102592 type:complete len:813 (+) Transcript_36935:562-3000(+)
MKATTFGLLPGIVQDAPGKVGTRDDLKRSGSADENGKPTSKRHVAEGSVPRAEEPPKLEAQEEAKQPELPVAGGAVGSLQVPAQDSSGDNMLCKPTAALPNGTDIKAKKKQERQQKTKEARELARREAEASQAEEERLMRERAAPFEGLSIEEIRMKRMAEVLEEMDGRMRDIVRRTAETLGIQAPSEETLATVCGSALDVDRREAYLRLIHTVQEAVSIPEGLQADLMPYQVDGLEWLVSIYVNNLHGILADEMGLGKTIQTIAWLQYLKEFKGNKGPHLIVAPKSTLANWETEFGKFAPTYKVFLVVGIQEEREHFAQKLRKRIKENKTTVYVTNYEQIHRNDWLQEVEWQCIVIDEGHRMKNQKSVLHETMTKMRCRTRMLLTGTPLQNNLNELWALLHYLLPELFTTTLDFQQWFLDPLRGVGGLNEYEVQLGPDDEAQLISRLHTMLAPFLLQRTKAQVMDQQLPPKVESTVRVPLSAWQQAAYADLQKRTIRLLSSEDKVEMHKVNNALMQLRKLVLHPYLFASGYQPGPDFFRTSGKVEVLDRMLAKLLRFGHKTLIFSQFTTALDILGEYLQWRGHQFVRLDGQTPHEERRSRIATFNSEEGRARVFLLSSRAGGLGLNLQAADTVILFDLDWNPQNDKQAIARAHRIGQQREVRVFRVLTDSSVERHMERRCREKLDLERKIIGAGLFVKGSSQEQRADMLRSVLGLAEGGVGAAGAAPAVGRPDGDEEATPPEELNRLLARSAEELAAFSKMDEELLAPSAGKSGSKEAPLLVRCGRLMRPDEVPDGFRLEDEEGGADDTLW